VRNICHHHIIRDCKLKNFLSVFLCPITDF
jgi:hypothetical protein